MDARELAKARSSASAPASEPSGVLPPLAVRKRLFVRAYVTGRTAGNGTASARAAGYRGGTKGLGIVAVRLLKKPDVREAIERALEAAGATLDRIAAEAGAMAFYTVRDLDAARRAVERGDVADLPDHVARAVVALEVTPGRFGDAVRVRGADKARALELFARLRGLMPADRRELSGPGGGPIAVAGAVTFYLPAPPRLVGDGVVVTALEAGENGDGAGPSERAR